MKIINVANDFSILPGGRKISDGSHTGEHFYHILVENLNSLSEDEVLEINFDGGLSAGSSFLDQSFAGLIRNHILTKSQFKKRIHLTATEHPEIIEKVNKYVLNA